MKDLLEYNFPEELKGMSVEELNFLALEIRKFLIDKVSKNGGHLSSNLGVVELTIALHKVFDSPKDKFIFDVGHQSYVHKILTGRGKYFDSLRKHGGISGFPKNKESIHDCYETGHSSTSISAAYGMAVARDLNNENYNVISLIGDGSMTGGEAFEALNNVGASQKKMIVILNDNGMSISENTGGFARYLSSIRTSKEYLNAKSFVKKNLNKIPKVGDKVINDIKEVKEDIKYSVMGNFGIMFEKLGFTYLGPVNGHNINDLIEVLIQAKNLQEPVLIHVITKKGKGYDLAEENPSKFHGISSFDKSNGELINKPINPSFSSLAGKYVLDKALNNKSIIAITAAMGDAVGLGLFSKILPERFFDVGIAEQHAVTFSAGMARSNLRPFVFIYSSFLQRAYDQMIEDVCLQNLPVIFMIDRAGVVGADGETHNGNFDISYLNSMPNMTIFTPHNKETLYEAIDKAYELNCPCAIRYPRGECFEEFKSLDSYENPEVLLFTCGKMYSTSLKVAATLNNKGIKTNIVDFNMVKPITLPKINSPKLICTLEDNSIMGGFGSIINCNLINKGVKIINFAWPDQFIEHGTFDELSKIYKMDSDSITNRILEELNN